MAEQKKPEGMPLATTIATDPKVKAVLLVNAVEFRPVGNKMELRVGHSSAPPGLTLEFRRDLGGVLSTWNHPQAVSKSILIPMPNIKQIEYDD